VPSLSPPFGSSDNEILLTKPFANGLFSLWSPAQEVRYLMSADTVAKEMRRV